MEDFKAKRKKEAIKYVKKCIARGHFPTNLEVNSKFNINYIRLTMKEIYLDLGVDFTILPRRPSGGRLLTKSAILEYVKERIKKNHFPSRRELDKKFKVDIGYLFGGIDGLYAELGLPYLQENSQELKINKARILTKIVLFILPKLGLKFVSSQEVHKRGVDILAKDNRNDLVGIELKAYCKFEPLKQRDVDQLNRYIKKYDLKYGILLTTSSTSRKLKIPRKIKILFFKDIITICSEKFQSELNYIRNQSVHIKTKERDLKKKQIVDYIVKNISHQNYVGAREISKDLGLNVYTYFENMDDAYTKAGVKRPFNKTCHIRNKKIRNKVKQELKIEILNWIREEINKGKYITGDDIKKKYGIKLIWNYFKLSDLYKELGIPTYLERKPRFHL